METPHITEIEQWNPRTRMTVGIILLIGTILLAYQARVIFTPLIIGGIVAYLLYPLARRISTATRLSHAVATALIYVILLGLLIPAGILITPLLSDQLVGLQDELTLFASNLEAAGANPITLLPGFEISTAVVVGEVGWHFRTSYAQ